MWILIVINISYISKFIVGKNLNSCLDQLANLKRNKFFFDNGILKSIISGIEIAIFDILAQANNINHANVIKNYFKKKNKIIENVEVYGSAGSINSNAKDLRKDINNTKKLNISTFKARIGLDKDVRNKINILKNEIDKFALDLIANTYKKNENINKLKSFLNYIKNVRPAWIEEALNTNLLYNFKKLKKYDLKFSYGENYNSFSDFVNLIEYYKFNFINPDISHLSTFDFILLCKFFDEKDYKNRIIIHCWGGAINFVYSLYIAQVFNKHVKLVEFPLTDSNFMRKVFQNISISNSKCSINENVRSFESIIDINKLERIKFSKLTFNFD